MKKQIFALMFCFAAIMTSLITTASTFDASDGTIGYECTLTDFDATMDVVYLSAETPTLDPVSLPYLSYEQTDPSLANMEVIPPDVLICCYVTYHFKQSSESLNNFIEFDQASWSNSPFTVEDSYNGERAALPDIQGSIA